MAPGAQALSLKDFGKICLYKQGAWAVGPVTGDFWPGTIASHTDTRQSG